VPLPSRHQQFHFSRNRCFCSIAAASSSRLVAYLKAAAAAEERRGGESFNDFCDVSRHDTTVSGRPIAAAANESTRSVRPGRKEGRRRQVSTFRGRFRCATRRGGDAGRRLLTAGDEDRETFRIPPLMSKRTIRIPDEKGWRRRRDLTPAALQQLSKR